MSADRGQLRTMRLLPFTAAADEAAWVADPRHDSSAGASKSACRPGLVRGHAPDHGECTRRMRSDLRLRSQRFSLVLGRSRGDVPRMCPGYPVVDA